MIAAERQHDFDSCGEACGRSQHRVIANGFAFAGLSRKD
jgi:hypothetical protein